MKLQIISAIFFCLVGGPALASDLPTSKGPPPPPSIVDPPISWAGFYAGIETGWAGQQLNNRYSAPGATAPPDYFPADASAISAGASSKANLNGAVFGGDFGYNWQYGNLVFGGEVDLDWLALDKKLSGAFSTPGAGTEQFSFNSRDGWLLTVGPRLGYAFGRMLVYAKGGLTVTESHFSETVAYDPIRVQSGTDVFSANRLLVGGAIGGGVEYAVTNNWSIKAEYLHVWEPNINGTSTTKSPFFANPTIVSYGHNINTSIDAAKIGLSYHLN